MILENYIFLVDFCRRKFFQKKKSKFVLDIAPAIYFSAMGLGNYEACKYFRRFTRELTPEEHGNVFCVTHPDSEGQGSTNSTWSAYKT